MAASLPKWQIRQNLPPNSILFDFLYVPLSFDDKSINFRNFFFGYVSTGMTIVHFEKSLDFDRQLYGLFLHPWKLNIHIYRLENKYKLYKKAGRRLALYLYEPSSFSSDSHPSLPNKHPYTFYFKSGKCHLSQNSLFLQQTCLTNFISSIHGLLLVSRVSICRIRARRHASGKKHL